MKSWKTVALAAVLTGAAGLGASLAPAALAQTRTRVNVAPHPISPRELVLRIKKLLARVKSADEPAAQIRLGELEIDVPRHSVTIKGAMIALTATEFRLLEILARRRGRVQTRERLLQDVWGYDNPIDSRTVDTHMRRLREKIGDTARHLETIRGVGYRFKAEE